MIRVLLVEDDKNLSFILKSSLEQMIGGYEVITASNGKDGLELLSQRVFDVIVSDVEMPVMDGRTMVQQIRKHYPSLPILFITGLTTARDVINGYQSGVDFYIKKTVSSRRIERPHSGCTENAGQDYLLTGTGKSKGRDLFHRHLSILSFTKPALSRNGTADTDPEGNKDPGDALQGKRTRRQPGNNPECNLGKC